MLKVVEVVWVIMAFVAGYQVYLLWGNFTTQFWVFLGFSILAVVMFFVRRKQRRAYEERQKMRDNQP